MQGLKGEKNVNWNGGTSEYPNHYLMKLNRKIKLKQTNGKCEICGNIANQIHHIDNSKNNHLLNNLLVVCRKCHNKIHSGRKNSTSKFIRLYGMTLKEMANRYGGSSNKYFEWHKQGILKKFAESKGLVSRCIV